MKKRIGGFLFFTAMIFSVIAESAEYTYGGTTFAISYEIDGKNVKIFKSLNGNSAVGETAIYPIPKR